MQHGNTQDTEGDDDGSWLTLGDSVGADVGLPVLVGLALGWLDGIPLTLGLSVGDDVGSTDSDGPALGE